MVPLALVVDDSMLFRHTVCRYLEERGCRVESATNGEEALAMLRDLRPDIIITDLQMPKMDGYQLIKALKGRPETSAIPIVILAAPAPGQINRKMPKQTLWFSRTSILKASWARF